MRAVIDTNVLMSGIFFGGVPGRVLAAWSNGRFELVATPLILGEYRRVSHELRARFSGIDIADILDLITLRAVLIDDSPIADGMCRDPDDDKFLSCALSCGAVIVSGDKDLFAADGSLGVRVVTAREFLATLE
ncbi:MAG: putative toxin-antitoxin system toxin component, PIN family [Phycisphaeraceae bacterium]|nr:putative toxin-antitoxin system toxin component, PIN family [Phycisphaeraceae bacterium]MBX3368518.1 putative toxin-antitoxin system toxin component, PIN family [Phycisphaeraceae bacterium]